MAIDELRAAVKQVTDLLDALQQRDSDHAQAFESAVESLQYVVGNTHANVNRMLIESRAQVAQQTQQAVQTTLAQELAHFDQALAACMRKLYGASDALLQAQHTAMRQVRTLMWKTAAVIGIAFMLLLAGGDGWLGYQLRRIQATQARMLSCDGKPCRKPGPAAGPHRTR